MPKKKSDGNYICRDYDQNDNDNGKSWWVWWLHIDKMDFGASSSFLENISNTLDLSHNSRVSFGWVCCQTIIKGDNMICGDSNVYLCHCNILKKALFMKQFSLLFQPPRESFGQNRGCIGFLFWWRPTPEIHLHKAELHLPPSTDRHSPHILR